MANIDRLRTLLRSLEDVQSQRKERSVSFTTAGVKEHFELTVEQVSQIFGPKTGTIEEVFELTRTQVLAATDEKLTQRAR